MAEDEHIHTPGEGLRKDRDQTLSLTSLRASAREITNPDHHIIQPGSIFEPEFDIEEIKELPHDERAAAIVEFKQKLIYQQHGYAMLRSELISTFKANPDITQLELVKIGDRYAVTYGFPPSSELIVKQCISEVIDRHKRVEKIFKDLSDPVELCHQVFGFTPVGEVFVTKGIITLNFQFSDKNDFARAYQFGGLVTDEKLKQHTANVGGFFVRSSNTSRKYSGLVIALQQRDTTTPTYLHEEQHAFHDVFGKFTEKPYGRIDIYKVESKDLKGKARLYAMRFFLEHRFDALLRVKDEILAFKKGDNIGDKFIVSYLVQPGSDGGHYDYLEKVRTSMDKYMSEGNFPDKVKERMAKMTQKILVTEYKVIIQDAIDAFSEFTNAGYTKSDVIDLLTPVPVDQWKKVAKRILRPEKLSVPQHRSKAESQQIEAIRRTLAQHAVPATDSKEPETQTDKLMRKLQAAANAKMK